jgi:hypothetical protein
MNDTDLLFRGDFRTKWDCPRCGNSIFLTAWDIGDGMQQLIVHSCGITLAISQQGRAVTVHERTKDALQAEADETFSKPPLAN